MFVFCVEFEILSLTLDWLTRETYQNLDHIKNVPLLTIKQRVFTFYKWHYAVMFVFYHFIIFLYLVLPR